MCHCVCICRVVIGLFVCGGCTACPGELHQASAFNVSGDKQQSALSATSGCVNVKRRPTIKDTAVKIRGCENRIVLKGLYSGGPHDQ